MKLGKEIATGAPKHGVLFHDPRCFPAKNHSTFLTNNLTEFIPSTTSLNPITSAPKVGVKNPNAAMGMATIL